MDTTCGDRTARRSRTGGMLVVLALSAGCASASDPTGDTDTTLSADPPAATAAPSTAAPVEPTDGPVASLQDVESATIRIETTGTYVQPGDSLADASEYSGVFTGSGFIIDPTGIAVTNHHVVTGAATIEAYVGDNTADPVSARVVGLSECSDLAVIDLEGDGYPSLEWYDGEIDAGLEIRLAGFPQGDPEFTLTSGIVSKADADGELPWASIDHSIEHDAAAQPGNSGGPLVAVDGRVVGVHFGHAQYFDSTTAQFWAISTELAAPLASRLAGGTDVEAIGVNGTAFVDDETGTSGIWVSSVETGSPAARVGLTGGDVIERLEGLPMGVDGTMTHYCNVLQSHLATDELSVQAFRPGDGVRLRGVLNGDEMTPIGSVTEQVDDLAVDDQNEEGETVASYTEYVTVTDDSGALEVQVPVEWNDINGDFPFEEEDGTEYGLGLEASPDLASYGQSWSTPGMAFSATPVSGDTAGLLDHNVGLMDFLDPCSTTGPGDYDDGFYTGTSQVFTDCGGTDTDYVVIAATPPDEAYNVFVQAQVVSIADIEALDRIIQTFVVVDPSALVGGPDEDGSGADDRDDGYRLVTDDTGTIQVEVPVAWNEVWTTAGFVDPADVDDETLWSGIGLMVSPDNEAWLGNWGVPGVDIAATSDFDPTDLVGWLNTQYLEDCTVGEILTYEDGFYTGLSRTSTGCGESGTTYVDIVAVAPDESHLVEVVVTIVSDADWEAYARIADSFLVTGDVPA